MKRSFIVFLLVFGSAIQAVANPALVTLGESDANNLTQLFTDQVAVIELSANPATGYRWYPDFVPAETLEFLGSEFDQQQPAMLGGWTTQRLYVVGAGAGLATLELLYKRPNTQDILDSKTYNIQSYGTYLGSFSLPVPDATPPAPVSFQTNLALPAHFSWCEQNGCTPVKDQGSCGSCWAFSTVGPFESAVKIGAGVTEDFAEQYLISCNSEGWGCNGGWWGHDYHQWKTVTGETEAGAARESVFPYQAADVPCNPPHAKAYQLQSWGYVTNDSSVPAVDQIKQAIYDRGPLSVAVCVNTQFQSYTGGVFTGPSCTGVNHGVVLVGWDDTDGAWYMKNSWNTGWGESGYMRIAYGVCQIGYAAAYVVFAGGQLNASFSYTSTGLTVSFTDTSQPPPSGSIVSWSWNFGDGGNSTQPSPAHTYAAAGTYSVTLTVTDNNANTDSATQSVTVPSVPQYCASASTNCTEEWIGQVKLGTFSNTSGAQNYSDFTSLIVALQPGVSYGVTLTPQFSGSSYTEYFRIWIDFNHDGDFTDTGEEVFGASGSSAVSGTIAIPAAAISGQTRLRVSMKYGAAPTSCETFTYGEVEDYTANIAGGPVPPTAAFSFSVSGRTVSFIDQSTDSDGSVVGWAWNFGDGSASAEQNPIHTYGAAGVYTVTLTATDNQGYTNTSSQQVTVTDATYCDSRSTNCTEEWIGQLKLGTFSNTSGAQNYSNFTNLVITLLPGQSYAVTVTPNFSGSAYTEYSRIWIDFNRDGDFTDAGEQVFAASGSSAVSGTITVPAAATSGQTRLRVSLKYGSGATPCEVFTYGEVEDYSVSIGGGPLPPTAAFSFSASGLTVNFVDESTDPDGLVVDWAWSFGDGSTSTEQDPIHTYGAAGVYNVTLTVADNDGYTDTLSQEVTVTNVAYCDSRSTNCTEEWIGQVKLGTFSNLSGAQNYSDFTSLIVALQPGVSYAVTLTPKYSSYAYTEYFRIWIDFNRDGDFTDTGEQVFAASGSSAVSGTITVPTTAVLGQTRLRVSLKYGSGATSCQIFTYGEVEDYTAKIGG